jgi:hypothetical protein
MFRRIICLVPAAYSRTATVWRSGSRCHKIARNKIRISRLQPGLRMLKQIFVFAVIISIITYSLFTTPYVNAQVSSFCRRPSPLEILITNRGQPQPFERIDDLAVTVGNPLRGAPDLPPLCQVTLSTELRQDLPFTAAIDVGYEVEFPSGEVIECTAQSAESNVPFGPSTVQILPNLPFNTHTVVNSLFVNPGGTTSVTITPCIRFSSARAPRNALIRSFTVEIGRACLFVQCLR